MLSKLVILQNESVETRNHFNRSITGINSSESLSPVGLQIALRILPCMIHMN